jgi:Family of unknown function (DUF5906)
LVQRPGDKPGIALVMRGRKGAGKSFLFENVMAPIIDGNGAPESYFQTADSKLVFGDFNAPMEKNVMFVAEEAFWAGDKRNMAKLNDLITCRYLPIHPKHRDPQMMRNFTRMVIIGNDDWLVPATSDERRYFVRDVSEKYVGKMWYFDALLHEIHHGGIEAFMYFLSQRDISKFDVRKVPYSVALDDQKEEALDVLDKFLYGILLSSQLTKAVDGRAKAYRTRLFDSFVRFEKSLANFSGVYLFVTPRSMGRLRNIKRMGALFQLSM